MQSVTKAVILMAGNGTRALPATKAVAKELFPIGNIPALLFLLEECMESGIKQVVLVISKKKKDVIRFLKHDKTLETLIQGTDKEILLERWRNVVDNLEIKFVYQGRMNGSAGAVWSARKYVKGQPFLIMNADDVFVTEENVKPASLQIIESFKNTGKFTVCALEVDECKVSNYGIIKPGKRLSETEVEVDGFKEKPKPKENPSNLASLGRYVVLPKVFENIKKCQKHKNGEVYLSEAIALESENNNLIACRINAKYYDLANNLEYIKCVLEMSLKDEKIKENLVSYLKNLVENQL